MVCLSSNGAGTVPVTVKSSLGLETKKSCTIQLSATQSVESLFNEISQEFLQQPDSIELIMQNNKSNHAVILNEHKDKNLGDIVSLDLDCRHIITVTALKHKQMNLAVTNSDNCGDDDLLLGASASPITGEFPSSSYESVPALNMNVDVYLPMRTETKMDTRPVVEICNYVGLVNQAMTCYLNSLIQALYMTPEFRNALYNWEFERSNTESDIDRAQSEAKSIPFQLQKLFLNLQTSSKSAVETTDLTSSFGWDLQAAWEQHDIQELCRVMFEALEQKFKDTKQANLINDLYEGKMLDYVKCLECSTEKSREDTFLDIPLPVRPFGSSVAYNSVEEALRAFVQPETLDGSNQYHCEKCNKKCDAHKGLKFIKFPYLLTLHLKRFDFDYSTMHRIKLNDKVVFPKTLNLNSFIPGACYNADSYDERDTAIKGDDCSTTDSGSALDDESCQGIEASSAVNGQYDNCQDDDEGIDVSSGNHHENEKNRLHEPKGPYLYELFSIMIHSGSASGGHYYAYIKDFQKDQWFCFNDQSVTPITEDDIRKTYGGGPQRGYYSGAYTSSTNAYMLMYRRIDKERNAKAMTMEEFPPHIMNLLKQMREKEERDRLNREKESDMFKMKIHCYHPLKRQMVDTKLYMYIDQPLQEAVTCAYERMKLQDVCSLEDCRLVSYNKLQECIDCSFEGDNLKFCDIASKINIQHNEWMIEIKQPGTEFQVFKPGGVNMKVYAINLENEEVDGPTNVRVNAGETIRELKMRLAKMLNMNVNSLKVVQETYTSELQYLEEDDEPIKFDISCTTYKLYVSNSLDDDPEKSYTNSKLQKVIDRFVNVITIDVLLPDTDVATLESLSIPSLDINQNIDRLDMAVNVDRTTNSPNLRVSPQPGVAICSNEAFGDQSNSEDSSLSDSDRTLVGDAPGDCLGLLSSSSNSPADQHMASPTDPAEDSYNPDIFGNPQEDMHWDEEEIPEPTHKCVTYYFKATMIQNYMGNDNYGADGNESKRCCKVLVDKRMSLGKFKKHLEPILGVPVEYFKIYRPYSTNNDMEWSTLTDTFRSKKDGDKLIVKLGRVLRKDEFLGKVYHLTPDNNEHFKLLFEWIIGKGQLVSHVKKDILIQAKKQHMLDIPYNKCRLRKKSWKDPGKIYLDDQRFVDDVSICSNFEIFLQELPEGEKASCSRQLVLFVKRWSPSTLSLSPFHEVVLDSRTVEDLKKKVAETSRIPLEFVEVAIVKQTFPCDMNVLCVHKDLDWNPTVPHLEDYPLQVDDDGSVFFYRDSREILKEITPEEKKEIQQREKTRLDKFSSRTYSSPRRERALKIYVDTSPNKNDDGGID